MALQIIENRYGVGRTPESPGHGPAAADLTVLEVAGERFNAGRQALDLVLLELHCGRPKVGRQTRPGKSNTNATMWDEVVRSNGLLVSSLAVVEEKAARLRTELETSGSGRLTGAGTRRVWLSAIDGGLL